MQFRRVMGKLARGSLMIQRLMCGSFLSLAAVTVGVRARLMDVASRM